MKSIESLRYLGAMAHPGGGKNDIPSRLKSKFFIFNMVLPSETSVDNIYGQILRAKYNTKNGAKEGVCSLVGRVTKATINLWNQVKGKMLPTPSRFHYIFNMRDLSRIFQQIVETPLDSIKTEKDMSTCGSMSASASSGTNFRVRSTRTT
jgi:dynein heavy chain